MKILKLKNEGEYRITENEAQEITKTWVLKGVTAPIFLPRLEIIFTPFQIELIKPIKHQLEHGLPIFIELKSSGDMMRVFYDKVTDEYLCDGKLGMENLGKKKDVEAVEEYARFIPEDAFFDDIGEGKAKLERNQTLIKLGKEAEQKDTVRLEAPESPRRYIESQTG